MSFESLMVILAPIAVILVIWGLIGIAFFIWYLAAMARLFPRIGLPGGQGWIPLWNDWRLIGRAGLPGWVAILYLIPVANLVPVVYRTIAQHRIGREVGVGGGYTAIGFFLPPLWATLIGTLIGPEGLRPAAAPFAAGFGAGGVTRADGAAGTPAAAPQPAAPFVPQPAATPYFGPGSLSNDSVARPPAAPDPWASPAQTGSVAPPAPAAAAAPATRPVLSGPLGSETEAEYARLAAEPFEAPPAAPLGHAASAEPFSWTAASQPAPDPAPERVVVPPPVHPVAAAPAPAQAPAPVAPPAAAPPATAPPATAPPAAAVELPAAPVSAGHKPTGITARYDPIPLDDDLDRTVVVHRPQRTGWVLELPDGERLELSAADVIVGRRPEVQGESQVLAIPDPTRTLSKTHARLRFDGEQWTVEDLGSTNGVVLLRDGGVEDELSPHQPVPTTERLLLGELEVRLSRSDERV